MSSEDRERGRSEAARAQLKQLVEQRFEGRIAAAAHALDVSAALLYDVLSGRRGVGFKLITSMAALTGATVDEILGRPRATPSDVVRHESTPAPVFEDLLGWREAERAARERSGLPAWPFERARRMSGLVPPSLVTPEFVIDAALMVLRHTPAPAEAPREAEGKRPREKAGKPARTKR